MGFKILIALGALVAGVIIGRHSDGLRERAFSGSGANG